MKRRRHSTPRVALALVLVLAAKGARAQDAQWMSLVDPKGWVLVGTNETTAVYFKPESIAFSLGTRRMWSRFEFRDGQSFSGAYPPFTYRSELFLYEYDCAGGRDRALQVIAYSGHNQIGDDQAQTSAAPAWRYPPPDTFDEALEHLACIPAGATRR